MQLRTAEPLADQLALTRARRARRRRADGAAVRAARRASARTMRARRSRPGSAVRVAPWLLGVAAALATAGVAAALGALVPAAAPLWPDVKFAGYAWPLGGRGDRRLGRGPGAGRDALPALGRRSRDRRLDAAASPPRRSSSCCWASRSRSSSGRDVGHALLQGVAEGGAAFVLAWLVLRYDLRTVPAFVATGIVLEARQVRRAVRRRRRTGCCRPCRRPSRCWSRGRRRATSCARPRPPRRNARGCAAPRAGDAGSLPGATGAVT